LREKKKKSIGGKRTRKKQARSFHVERFHARLAFEEAESRVRKRTPCLATTFHLRVRLYHPRVCLLSSVLLFVKGIIIDNTRETRYHRTR